MKDQYKNIRYVCVYCHKAIFSTYRGKGSLIIGSRSSLPEKSHYSRIMQLQNAKLERHTNTCKKFREAYQQGMNLYYFISANYF